MTSTPVTYSIGIYSDGNSLSVAPGQLQVARGSKLVFHNFHSNMVIVSTPDQGLTGKPETVPVTAGSDSAEITVSSDAEGPYPYTVYDPLARDFAHASVPIIIVYPRAV